MSIPDAPRRSAICKFCNYWVTCSWVWKLSKFHWYFLAISFKESQAHLAQAHLELSEYITMWGAGSQTRYHVLPATTKPSGCFCGSCLAALGPNRLLTWQLLINLMLYPAIFRSSRRRRRTADQGGAGRNASSSSSVNVAFNVGLDFGSSYSSSGEKVIFYVWRHSGIMITRK